MQTEKDYFEKRDGDIMSGFGTIELEYICKEIENTRAFEKKGENIVILDVGCGSGMSMIRMQKEFLHLKNIRGIDLSELAINIAKKRGLNVEMGNAEKLDQFKDNEFDFVYSQHTLEHTDPVKTLNAVIRIAKKSVFIFPMGETYDFDIEEFKFKFENEKHKTLFHNYIMTEELLLKIFREVPHERHRIIKGIIKYTVKGHKHENWMIVIYKQKKNENKQSSVEIETNKENEVK